MCAVSAVLDNYRENLPQRSYWDQVQQPFQQLVPPVSREEFEALRRDMEELKKLLTAAKEYDKATGQPDCETAEKIELVRKLAKFVGVDLSSIA